MFTRRSRRRKKDDGQKKNVSRYTTRSTNCRSITNRSALHTSRKTRESSRITSCTRNRSANTAKNWKSIVWSTHRTLCLLRWRWSIWSDELQQVRKRSICVMKKYSMKRRKWNNRTMNRNLDDELQNRRHRLLLYLLNNSMTAIKEFVEMWYLMTFSKFKEPSVVYVVPRSVCERVMWLKNIPNDQRPKIIDLNEYGYWYESLSMIRGAKKYDQTEGESEFFVMTLSSDWRQKARKFIDDRAERHLVTTYDTLKNRCTEKSIS